MKKIFLLSVAVCIAGFTSCLNNNDSTTNEVSAGIAIYNTAKTQVNNDLDPILIALRLNTLIETADKLGVEYDKAEVVIVEEDKDEEIEEETALAVERLFGSNKVTRSGTQWTIDFSSTDMLEKEQSYRIGTVTIETNGHKLTELAQEGSMWEFKTASAGYDLYFPSTFKDKFINKFDYYYIEPDGAEGNSWNISAQSKSYFGTLTETAANVELEYTLTNEGGGSFFYNDILSAAFYLSGTSTGRFIFTDNINTAYEAKRLKFRPTCYLSLTYGGTETATIDRSALSLEEFPSNHVRYNWYDATATTSCGNTVQISYNGYTYDTGASTSSGSGSSGYYGGYYDYGYGYGYGYGSGYGYY